ncbi:CDP-glycerol glycerophosphotransferase family protein [Enterococcus saccharolyticus]|uniref:CDP-glycerol:poly(Glycerophosphate) glycerophosphotransferase n=1 Tax=Enterococcus saccharolyticus subsp. saccharolyticus ATCC 43076 TaxID=1139996 RepID=S0NX83_9ENTE|nr:CDP-glycerol glycerophosphotransferase family protein [Enterococcus saccharolyticus]EOT29626.1 hypothetical protein OMQ_00938 [Enterococcus saccharolyticus subsp. saccharolyticus ATCC 43076]EOT80786.1 hypothetical protein I572_01317 [Enterococcus saccharolyticus subsp. saccharolyticus ATCC 43076]OJG86214.1 hypothetical protein RV16_GL001215 [Enterococcus saccharolyticus]
MRVITSLSKDIYLKLVKKSADKTKLPHQKIVYLLSFPSTSSYVLKKLYEKFGNKLLICYTKDGLELAQQYKNKGCTIYNIDHFPTLLKDVVPIIVGSKVILCDNYYAFLAGVRLSSETVVVQLWHANGAIKSFGLSANYTKNVSSKDQKRYLDVYQKFTHYVVSSEKMSEVFANNYQQPIVSLPFGYLPTDYYFDDTWLATSKKKFDTQFLTKKKIALYVPTYREKYAKIPLDFSKISNTLGSEWLLFVKAHPHDKQLENELRKEKTIITDFKGMSLQELLPSVDCLITDYSSVPFEYSLANPNGKIIFFCYDLLEYQNSVGLEKDFTTWAPGRIVKNEKELLQEIQHSNYRKLDTFNQLWNEYVNGKAANQLVEWVNNKYEN